MSTSHQVLPPRPQPPVDYDCCGGGCADCDLRRYQQALGEWLKLAEAAAGNAAKPAT
ncbi:MAG: oxidoreductase-like domain-containing protein [Pseudomonadota bacterium]